MEKRVDQTLENKLLSGVIQYAFKRKQVEEALRKRTQQIIRYQAALLELAKAENSDLDSVFKKITEIDARMLEVERVSIWFFSEDHSEIVCQVLYKFSVAVHERGMRLRANRYPRYFQALEESRTVAADDARTDPRTSEFTQEYLIPFGVTSMMDVPIRLRGKVVGIVCHEHTGPRRQWTAEEQNFAASVSDMVSLSLASSERLRMEKMKEELFRDAAHELRTPYAMIKMGLDMMDRGFQGSEQHEVETGKKIIVSNLERMEHDVEHILDTFRIESGIRKGKAPDGGVSLNSFFKEIAETYHPQVQARGLELRLELEESLPPVSISKDDLLVVLRNVLDNAVKFTEKGTITIRARRQDESIAVFVEDTGRGIRKEELRRVFEKFFKVNPAAPGVGLGLTIAKLLVERCEGTIAAASPGLDQGTAVEIRLPVSRLEATSQGRRR